MPLGVGRRTRRPYPSISSRRAGGAIQISIPNLRSRRSTFTMTSDVLADLRHAMRALRRAPVYTVTAVLTLAIGIGATTAAYSVVSHVLIDPLPYDRAEQLVNVWSAVPQFDKIPPSYPDFLDYRAQNTAFASMAFETGEPVTVRRHSGAFQMNVAATVTEDFFSVLRATPTIGRTLVSADFVAGASPAGGPGLWCLGRPTSAASRTSLVARSTRTLGVIRSSACCGAARPTPDWAPEFHTDIYVPLNTVAHVQAALRNRGNHADSRTLARLHPGVTIDQARRRSNSIAARLATAYPATDSGFVGNVTPSRMPSLAPFGLHLAFSWRGACWCSCSRPRATSPTSRWCAGSRALASLVFVRPWALARGDWPDFSLARACSSRRARRSSASSSHESRYTSCRRVTR